MDPVPQWLTDCVKYADDHDHQLIACLDSNAHSGLFGPQPNNRRGDAMEDFILTNGLLVHNQGSIPTFEVVRGQTIASSFIDVTLSLGVDYLYDWHVSRAFNGSDHNSIHFQIPVAPLPFKDVRPWKTAKWDLFKKLLDKPFIPPDYMTKKKLDRLTEQLTADIRHALDITCPVFRADTRVVANRWFTASHEKLLDKVRLQYKLHKRVKGQESVKYFSLLRKYKRNCKKAKKQSWHKYVSDTPSETHMSHLSQLIQHRQKNRLNFLEKADQTGLTTNGTDTIFCLLYTSPSPRDS